MSKTRNTKNEEKQLENPKKVKNISPEVKTTYSKSLNIPIN